jgi:hypothetical protein
MKGWEILKNMDRAKRFHSPVTCLEDKCFRAFNLLLSLTYLLSLYVSLAGTFFRERHSLLALKLVCSEERITHTESSCIGCSEIDLASWMATWNIWGSFARNHYCHIFTALAILLLKCTPFNVCLIWFLRFTFLHLFFVRDLLSAQIHKYS